MFFVTIALTIEPDFISFLKISNFTSSLEKIFVISSIINGFLKSGLSVPYFKSDSEYEILGNFSKTILFFENFLNNFKNNFSTTLNTSS